MPSIEWLYLFAWWLAVTLAGLAAWPIAAHLLRGLPDLGYGLARALGLLIAGYAFWLLTSFGFLRNDAGGVLLAFALLAALGGWAGTRAGWGRLRDWARAHRRLILGYEALFLFAFAAWATVRAFNPNLMSAGGEKWMEYAFLNAIQRSPTFPPMDPWLSGYAISYYYFGYVLVAALATVTGVPLSHGFNLGIALLFALTALGVTGIVFNLISLARAGRAPTVRRDGRAPPVPVTANPRRPVTPLRAMMDRHVSPIEAPAEMPAVETPVEAPASDESPAAPAAPSFPTADARLLIPALLGAVLVLIIGNFEGAWEAAHARGWGSPAFWSWLDINNLADAPVTGTFTPNDNYWWWRASRTVNDRDFRTGAHVEVIDEFPFFSFMLGDMHPHVLALPFAFLAMGVALSFCLRPPRPWRGAGGDRRFDLARGLLAALVLGGLAFLNTWDFPIYLFVVAAAYGMGRLRDGAGESLGRRAVVVVAGIAAAGIALYLPFYAGFASQAGGILPNVAFPTKFQQFATMFGPLLVPATAFLAWLLHARRRRIRWRLFAGLTLGSAFGLLILSWLMGGLLLQLPAFRQQMESAIAPHGWGEALRILLRDRLIHSATTLWLGAIVGAAGTLAISILIPSEARPDPDLTPEPVEAARGDRLPVAFALLLLGTGALLILGPEFIYLRDLFGTRMNTVFKFYYQAWVLWGTAGAFGIWYMFQRAGAAARWLTAVALGLALALALVYPALALPEKTDGFKASPHPTLDSTTEFATYNPDDFAAIQWLRANVAAPAVLLEATGGSYTAHGRVSAFTGIPTVLGWDWHEIQWRGTAANAITQARKDDVTAIYAQRDWDTVEPLLSRYGVEYVYVGTLERGQFGEASLRKFDEQMRKVYENSSVAIYQRLDEEPVPRP